MANSSRRRTEWFLLGTDVALYAFVALGGYLSQERMWRQFWVLAAISTVLYLLIKVFQAKPGLKDLLAFENQAGQIARSATSYGVVKFYNMQLASDQAARNEDTQSAISAANTMWLCANSGASYLDPGVVRHWPAVERRLRDNASFKVVLLAPTSKEKALRNLLNVGEDADDSKLNLPNLVRLYNNYPGLELRFVDHGMYGTVFATDSRLFYDPYHLGVVGQRIENRSFCLQLERKTAPHGVPQGVGYYELFKAHFDTLWRTSTDFEEWIEENAEYYPNLPSLKARHKRMKNDAR